YAVHTGVSIGSTTSNVLQAPLPDNDIRLNCPDSMFGPGNPSDNVAALSCSPSSITRGSSTTCTVNNAPSAATFSNWKFTDSNNNTVTMTGNNNVSSCSGTVVTGGTVSVTVSASGSNTVTPT